MIFVAIPIIAFLILFGIKYKKPKNFFEDNMSPAKTTSINGLFVMIVIFQHFKQYITWDAYDKAYYSIALFTTQLIVVSFLFFSGYGMMESTKKKGFSYIQSIPKKRFPKLFIDFVIAILLFLIMNLCIGKNYTWQRYLLSLTGWISVGNSNWYMFAVFCFYIIMYLSFLICKKRSNLCAVIVTTILSIGYIVGMHFCQPAWYYDTFICLPAGMFFSLYKDKILAFFKSKYYAYIIISFAVLASFVVLFIFCRDNPFVFNIISILFALLLYLTTLKLSIHNCVLNWLGKYTFWIYILQRIPMIVLKQVGLASVNKFLYFFVCLAATLVLAVVMKFVSGKIENLIWRKPKPKAPEPKDPNPKEPALVEEATPANAEK